MAKIFNAQKQFLFELREHVENLDTEFPRILLKHYEGELLDLYCDAIIKYDDAERALSNLDRNRKFRKLFEKYNVTIPRRMQRRSEFLLEKVCRASAASQCKVTRGWKVIYAYRLL